MDMNMRFNIILQAIAIELQFYMEIDNFLFETTTIFVVSQEVHNGVFQDYQDIGIQMLGRIFQAYMNYQ